MTAKKNPMADITPRQWAEAGPISEKKPGSVAWCWQIMRWLGVLWKNRQIEQESWAKALDAINEHRVWEHIPPEKPYGSIDALFQAELGTTLKEATASVVARAATAVPIAPHGGDRRSEKVKDQGDNDNLDRKRGTSADYLTARIARDHPAIHERMKAGEFKSVRAAAIEAGIVQPRKPKQRNADETPVVAPPSGKAASKATVKTIIEDVAPALRPADATRVVHAALDRLDPDALDGVARRVVPTVESATLTELLVEIISKLDEHELESVVLLAAKRIPVANRQRLGKALRKILGAK